MSLSHKELYEFGEFLLDARTNTLSRLDGTLVPLKPKVVETLTALVRERGQTVSKDELFALLWPDTVVEEANLTQNIYLLRKTLGAEGFIETLSKRGYRFIAPVTEISDAPALANSGLVIEKYREARVVIEENGQISGAWDLSGNQPVPLLPPAKAYNRRWAYLALAIVLAAVVSGAIWFVASRWQKTLKPNFPTGATRVRRITSLPAHEEDADFAPDGQSFAFASRQGGAGLYKIYLMSINGGAERRLTNSPAEETVPRFSPDGRWIAFDRAEASGNLSIWKVSPFGGPESLLVPQAALPAWSPDGRELAFVRALPDGQRELARRNLTDGNERRVISFAQHIDTLAWSPDGQTLAFTSDGNLWLVAAAGGAARRLGEKRVQTATWTPDSQALLCGANWSGRTNLWLVPVNGDAPSRLTSGGGVDFYPTLARQGSRLLYTNELWRRSVWAVDENGANPRPLGGKDSYLALAAHPSRRAFIYADYETADGMEQNGLLLGLQDLDNREQRVLGEGNAPGISPDGAHIACLRPVAQHYELWQLTAETSAARRLTTTPAWEVRPAYSRDGRRVAFHRAGTTPGLTLLELATGQETPLAAGQFRAPAFSPDGRWLAASGNSANGLGLYLFDLATGQGRRVSELSSYEAAPVWSGDSQTLRLLVNEQTQPVLVRLNLAGQEMAPRLALDYPPDPNMLGIFQIEQLPGGGWLYLLTRVEGDIYLMEPGN